MFKPLENSFTKVLGLTSDEVCIILKLNLVRNKVSFTQKQKIFPQ